MLYVDALKEHRRFLLTAEFCHLATDGAIEELHAFAHRLGFSRASFHFHPHHPHYDLSPKARAAAIVHGAIEVTSKELVKRCFGGASLRRPIP